MFYPGFSAEKSGFSPGNIIFESVTRVGTEIVQEIGELSVVNVHKDVAECKVTKGGKEVMLAMERYIENVDTGDANAKPLKVVIKK